MRDALRRLIARSGAPPEPLAALVEAAVARGPTPASGPLRHDLLVGQGRFGLTLFAVARDPGLEALAVAFAERWGRGDEVRALLDAGSEVDPWHVGVRWEGGWTLKLYRSGSALRGVDVSDAGTTRRRSYTRVDAPAFPEVPGWSHTIEARLATGDATDGRGKTTTAVIFRPGAPCASLDRAATVLRPGATPFAALGLRDPRLRAAALELDRWDDGHEAFDVLLTLA